MLRYWICVMVLLALVGEPCQAKNPGNESGTDIGREFKRIGKDTGKASKDGSKEVGLGFKNFGKETGKALKEGGKEGGHAAKKTGKSVGDWFRGLGHSFKKLFIAE